jgi:hypothetical protein
MTDIEVIMDDAPAAGGGKAAEGAEVAGPTYDIWYLFKVLLVMALIVGVVDYFFNKRIRIPDEKKEDEKHYSHKKRKRKK